MPGTKRGRQLPLPARRNGLAPRAGLPGQHKEDFPNTPYLKVPGRYDVSEVGGPVLWSSLDGENAVFDPKGHTKRPAKLLNHGGEAVSLTDRPSTLDPLMVVRIHQGQ